MEFHMSPNCPYCHHEMNELGFVEDADDLGVYIAETFCCEECAYRLERNPVYIFGAPEGEHLARQVAGSGFTVTGPEDAPELRS